jgi:hypothetical protein
VNEGYVYFIQADGNGPIKIGFTSEDPARRLNQLQTGNASALKLLGAIKGSHARERQFHAELAEWRLQGEWFESHPTVLAIVEDAMSAETAQKSDVVPHCSICLQSGETGGEIKVLLRGCAGNVCDICIRVGAKHLDTIEAAQKAREQYQARIRTSMEQQITQGES